jgi:hypothetical protein
MSASTVLSAAALAWMSLMTAVGTKVILAEKLPRGEV